MATVITFGLVVSRTPRDCIFHSKQVWTKYLQNNWNDLRKIYVMCPGHAFDYWAFGNCQDGGWSFSPGAATVFYYSTSA